MWLHHRGAPPGCGGGRGGDDCLLQLWQRHFHMLSPLLGGCGAVRGRFWLWRLPYVHNQGGRRAGILHGGEWFVADVITPQRIDKHC